jgi:hypothetical protein
LAKRKTLKLDNPADNSVEYDSPSKSPTRKKGAKTAKSKPKDKKKK